MSKRLTCKSVLGLAWACIGGQSYFEVKGTGQDYIIQEWKNYQAGFSVTFVNALNEVLISIGGVFATDNYSQLL